MRLNEHVAVITNKLVLVPYEASHVETYSEWMADESIRAATASERLSLPEEYTMQKSWREDADKLTFILCLPSLKVKGLNFEGVQGSLPDDITVVEGVDDRPEFLIGDVNLFISEDEDDDEDSNGENDGSKGEEQKTMKAVGELELMIAKTGFQGQGLGKIAVLVFIIYVLRHQEDVVRQYADKNCSNAARLSFEYLRVKIGKENTRSLGLFQKLGFIKTTEEPNYFGEWELRLNIDGQEKVEKQMRDMLKLAGVDWIEEVMYWKLPHST